jgi:ornithine carbamoyltransferase
MYPSLNHRHIHALEQMSPRELDGLLASARALKLAADAGSSQPLLRGKNLGLFSEAQDSIEATLFHRAATDLGAHVAHILPSVSGLKTPQDVRHTARMLGRLYDAVECQGLSPELVEQLDRDAGIPVYDSLARTVDATTDIAQQLDGDGPVADNRRYLLQALLVGTIG